MADREWFSFGRGTRSEGLVVGKFLLRVSSRDPSPVERSFGFSPDFRWVVEHPRLAVSDRPRGSAPTKPRARKAALAALRSVATDFIVPKEFLE